MKPITAFFLAFLFVIALQAGTRVTNLTVTTEGRDINVSWEMIDQSGVHHFNVERRTSDQESFTRINSRSIPLDPSRRYEFVDRTVYKQENAIVFYRIAIVETNGSTHYSDHIPLGKISSVRRTWGSIKSMFR